MDTLKQKPANCSLCVPLILGLIILYPNESVLAECRGCGKDIPALNNRYELTDEYRARCHEDLQSKGNIMIGQFTRVSEDNLFFIHCQGENMVSHHNEKNRAKRLNFVFGFKNNQLFYCRVIPYGSLVDVSERDKVLHYSGTLDKGKVEAEIEFQQDLSDLKEKNIYRLTISGLLIGDRFNAKTNSILKNGQTVNETGTLSGSLESNPVKDAANSLITLTLQDAIPNRFMNVFIVMKNGRPTQGFATTPNFNNAIHSLFPNDLVLKNNRITGNLEVKINPDPWVPKDGAPMNCLYQVDIEIRDATCVGTFSGNTGGLKVSGTTEGELQESITCTTENINNFTVKLEDALSGGEAWQNRIFLNFKDINLGCKKGKVSNNHTSLSGIATLEQIQLNKGKFNATCRARVENGNVMSGDYLFHLNGIVVNRTVVGDFTTFQNNMETKKGSFWMIFD